jgi:hypothetical protein
MRRNKLRSGVYWQGVLGQKGIKQAGPKTSGPHNKGHMYLLYACLWSKTLQNFPCPTLIFWQFLPQSQSQSQNSHDCHVIVSQSTETKREKSKDLSIHLSSFITVVAIFWKPNAIPPCFSCEKLLVSRRAPPQVVDRGTLIRYVGYRGNKIPRVDQN